MWVDVALRDEGALRLRRGAVPPSSDAGVRRRASARTSCRAMRAMRGCPRACVHAARARPRCRWRWRRGLEALQPQSAPGVHLLAQVQHDNMAARGAEGVFRGVGGAAVEGRLSCPLACRAARSRCGTSVRLLRHGVMIAACRCGLSRARAVTRGRVRVRTGLPSPST